MTDSAFKKLCFSPCASQLLVATRQICWSRANSEENWVKKWPWEYDNAARLFIWLARFSQMVQLSDEWRLDLTSQEVFVQYQPNHTPAQSFGSSFMRTVPSSSVFPQKCETLLIYLETNGRCQREILPTLTPGVFGRGHADVCVLFLFIHMQKMWRAPLPTPSHPQPKPKPHPVLYTLKWSKCCFSDLIVIFGVCLAWIALG